MEFTFRVDIGLISGVLLGLVLFGLGFNALTSWAEQKGYMDGFTSLFVALGVLMTLAPFALVNPIFALLVLAGFFASGLPMIVGSIVRYIKRREQTRKEIARLSHANPSDSMAE